MSPKSNLSPYYAALIATAKGAEAGLTNAKDGGPRVFATQTMYSMAKNGRIASTCETHGDGPHKAAGKCVDSRFDGEAFGAWLTRYLVGASTPRGTQALDALMAEYADEAVETA
jgi:hypothetical protein